MWTWLRNLIAKPIWAASVTERGEEAVRAYVRALVLNSLSPLEDTRESALADIAAINYGAPPAVPLLVELMGDRRAEMRQAVGEALGLIGPGAHDAVPTLINALKDVNAQVRGCAAEALGKIGASPECVVAALTVALSDPDSLVRGAAAGALGRFGCRAETAVPWLIRALADKHEYVRSPAACALGDIGPSAQAAAATLERLLVGADKPFGLRLRYALARLTREPDQHTRVLADGLTDRQLGGTAAFLLARLGRNGVQALIGALAHADPYAREAAGRALISGIGPGQSDAVPVLIEALRNKDVLVRRAACSALKLMGPDARDAIVPLGELSTGDEDSTVRAICVQAFGQMGVHAQPAVSTLINALSSKYTRCLATRALAGIGSGATAASGPLTQMLYDADEGTVASARYALARITGQIQDHIPALIELVKNRESRSREDAIEYLGLIGPAAVVAMPQLIEALSDESSSIRRCALTAIGGLLRAEQR